MKIIVLLPLVSLFIAGCSSSIIKSEDKVDYEEYQNNIKNACLKSGDYADASASDELYLCEHHAERSLKTAERLFNTYQEDNLLKECGELEGIDFSNCAKDFQHAYYKDSSETVIEKIYGQ